MENKESQMFGLVISCKKVIISNNFQTPGSVMKENTELFFVFVGTLVARVLRLNNLVVPFSMQ